MRRVSAQRTAERAIKEQCSEMERSKLVRKRQRTKRQRTGKWEYTSGAPPAGWRGAGYPTDAMRVSQSEKQRNCMGRDIAVRLWRDPCVPQQGT